MRAVYAKWASVCAWCFEQYPEGEEIAPIGRSWGHVECADAAEDGRQPPSEHGWQPPSEHDKLAFEWRYRVAENARKGHNSMWSLVPDPHKSPGAWFEYTGCSHEPCCTCGAPADTVCLNTSGRVPRAPHKPRVRVRQVPEGVTVLADFRARRVTG